MSKLIFQALASTADGAFAVDRTQRIVYWNQAAEELLEHMPREVLGKPCHELLNGRDNRGQAICRRECPVAATALRGNQIASLDMSVRTKSGDLRWINTSTLIHPGSCQDPGPTVIHLFRNVTRRKKDEHLLHEVLSAADRLRDERPSGFLLQESSPSAAAELTERERDVLSLLVQGLGTAEMAQALFISDSTVRNHIRNILGKFHVHSRIEAVIYALKHGLVSLE